MDTVKMIIADFWATFAEMSPYLLFGFFVAGLLSVLVSQRFVETHLGGRGIWPLIKASVFGVPLPLCSCGVIPVSMSLHKHGASRGATISFLLSTPQTGVDSIFVTLSLLGPLFAVFRPLAAFATGIFGGAMVNVFDKPSAKELNQQNCTDDCCSKENKHSKFSRAFKYAFVTLPRDIAKPMLIGVAVAALISAFVPDNFFADRIGTGIGSMIVMMLVGIPVYVCATASVPVAAALIIKGLSPGAALVFLMTGPATNAASFAVIWKNLGPKTAILYLLSVAFCALTAGFLINIIARGTNYNMAEHIHSEMIPALVQNISAVFLLAVLFLAVFRKPNKL